MNELCRRPAGNYYLRSAPSKCSETGGRPQDNPPVGSGAGRSGSRPGYETGRFTSRRFRTALSSWRASIRGTDILVAGIVATLSLGLAAYVYARAQAAAHLAFADQAQRLQAAVAERLSAPLEDSAALSSLLEAFGRVTRRQFRLLTSPMLRPDPLNRRRGLVYALEWLPIVSERERPALEAEARGAGLAGYRLLGAGSGREADRGRPPPVLRADPLHGAAQRGRARLRRDDRIRSAGTSPRGPATPGWRRRRFPSASSRRRTGPMHRPRSRSTLPSIARAIPARKRPAALR